MKGRIQSTLVTVVEGSGYSEKQKRYRQTSAASVGNLGSIFQTKRDRRLLRGERLVSTSLDIETFCPSTEGEYTFVVQEDYWLRTLSPDIHQWEQ